MSDESRGKVVWSASADEIRPFHVRSGAVFLGAFATRRKAVRRAKHMMTGSGWANVRVLDVRLSSPDTQEAPHE